MTCEECKQNFWPFNPEVPVFNRQKLGYDRPFCEACPNYPPDKETVVYADMQWTPRQWDRVRQLEGSVRYLQQKYQELLNERKQSGKLFIQKS